MELTLIESMSSVRCWLRKERRGKKNRSRLEEKMKWRRKIVGKVLLWRQQKTQLNPENRPSRWSEWFLLSQNSKSSVNQTFSNDSPSPPTPLLPCRLPTHFICSCIHRNLFNSWSFSHQGIYGERVKKYVLSPSKFLFSNSALPFIRFFQIMSLYWAPVFLLGNMSSIIFIYFQKGGQKLNRLKRNGTQKQSQHWLSSQKNQNTQWKMKIITAEWNENHRRRNQKIRNKKQNIIKSNLGKKSIILITWGI